MKFKDHSELYFQRMDASVTQKSELLGWIPQGSIAELGSGSGALAEQILSMAHVHSLLAIDASEEAIEQLSARFGKMPHVEISRATLGVDPDPFEGRQFDSIVASSILHEVYSFIGLEGLGLLASQISEALVPGGRFILRDGVREDHSYGRARMVLPTRLQALAQRYVSEAAPMLRPVIEGEVAYGNCHQIAEMAFTVTWGEESFDREVQEQYQLYDLRGAEEFFGGYGLSLVESQSLIQPGYVEHLQDSPMERMTAQGQWEPWFPPTNGMWIFQKPLR